MVSLGYERYCAQGGDWGSAVSAVLGEVAPERVAGVHLNLASVAGTFDDPTPAELANLEAEKEMQRTGRGYSAIQATGPQTLGYGLTDSPAGQAAWIAEKFWAWTDNNGHPADALSRQTILDEISVYWFTASATSSARLYWESFANFRGKVTAPSGLSVYPRDITRPSRREAELRFTALRWFEELPHGGHFAALEQPERWSSRCAGSSACSADCPCHPLGSPRPGDGGGLRLILCSVTGALDQYEGRSNESAAAGCPAGCACRTVTLPVVVPCLPDPAARRLVRAG